MARARHHPATPLPRSERQCAAFKARIAFWIGSFPFWLGWFSSVLEGKRISFIHIHVAVFSLGDVQKLTGISTSAYTLAPHIHLSFVHTLMKWNVFKHFEKCWMQICMNQFYLVSMHCAHKSTPQPQFPFICGSQLISSTYHVTTWKPKLLWVSASKNHNVENWSDW